MREDNVHKDLQICEMVPQFYSCVVTYREEVRKYRKKGFFDFKSIDLLETDLYHLKNKTHEIYRKDDGKKNRAAGNEELFDLIISSIFHEVLHLKEYIYTLGSYEKRYLMSAKKLKQRRSIHPHEEDFVKHSMKIVREAEEELPAKVDEVESLFRDALSQLEKVLPKYRYNDRLIRSIYFEGQLFQKLYGKAGIDKMYEIMYEGGPVEGYYIVGQSFLESGFYKEAKVAFESAIAKYKRGVDSGSIRRVYENAKRKMQVCHIAKQRFSS